MHREATACLRVQQFGRDDPKKNKEFLRTADQQARAFTDSLREEWDEASVRATMAVPHAIPTVRRQDGPQT